MLVNSIIFILYLIAFLCSLVFAAGLARWFEMHEQRDPGNWITRLFERWGL